MKYAYKTLLILFLTTAVSFGNPIQKHEKNRTIKKEFTVNKNAKLAVDNKYGDINITTWDKNKIEIEVQITIKGDDLDNVEERLENIDVVFDANSNYVSAKTTFANTKKNWSWWGNGRQNISQKINYIIKMPKTNYADLNNDYGSIYLDYLEATANINCDYGKIEIGELKADNNSINIDYCSSSNIKYAKSCNINADYSKLTIEKSEKMNVNMDYTTLKVGEVGTINFNTDYGGITIDDTENVIGNGDYTALRFGSISKKLIVESDYGSIQVKNLKEGFELVDINSQYASVRIEVDKTISFTFEMDLQYAGFKTDLNGIEYFKKISKSSKNYYEGSYGNASQKGIIKVHSQYGGVSINQN